MFKVTKKLRDVEITAEAPTMVEVYEKLARLEEVFGSQYECGFCKQKVFRHQFRKVDKFKFCELRCVNKTCKAIFRFGEQEGGVLFPQWAKGKGKKRVVKPNGGWEKYSPDAKPESTEE